MLSAIRFLWNATRGYRLTPWRSPYLKWRMETYSGLKAESIGFVTFLAFVWRERSQLLRFLLWTGTLQTSH